jgi:hypothetical protein
MAFDLLLLLVGAIVGLPQLWRASAGRLPRNLAAASALLGAAAVTAAIAGCAHLCGAPVQARNGCLLCAAAIFIVWILMIVSLARHNTSM